MKGMDLARGYFEHCGKKMLQEKFPDLYSRMAVGLVGLGSECLGFDDKISRDHDFGPGFCIWLREDDYIQYGAEVQKEYQKLPKTFWGMTRTESRQGKGRVGVFSISKFYRQFLGQDGVPDSLVKWLMIPEDRLCCASNGEVFSDPLGDFSTIRKGLQNYYPEDVRIKKIAAKAAIMAQSGQYNYQRCMQRGETVAAQLAVSEFLKAAMHMIYLCNRVYAPFYKWMFHGLRFLPVLSEAVPLLEELALLPVQTNAWNTEKQWKDPEWLNREDQRQCLIENICQFVVDELNRQELTTSNASFLEHHTVHLLSRIQDEQLKHIPVMIG